MTPSTSHRNPFWYPGVKAARQGCTYHGPFGLTAERFGIADLLQRWLGVPADLMTVKTFSAYFTLVQVAGMAHIASYTLQRINEVVSLRADCLSWENDEKLGRVPMISGETTKTEKDTDARWLASPSVATSITALTVVASLRMRCAAADPAVSPSASDLANPYLVGNSYGPWNGRAKTSYSIRVHPGSYFAHCKHFDRLFDHEQLRITEEDLRIAKMLTPTLSEEDGFAVGRVWPLAWHQLRRTTAVNMSASTVVSDSSLQFQMKHLSRLMPLYYTRGFAKLQMNEEVEGVLISAMYESVARNLEAAVGDRFVSPLGPERKEVLLVNMIGQKDARQLEAAASRGRVHFRKTRLGACLHRGTCSYGGIESASHCAGGDGSGPCVDALFDRENIPQVERDLLLIEEELRLVPVDSPRHKALIAERTALEIFLKETRDKK